MLLLWAARDGLNWEDSTRSRQSFTTCLTPLTAASIYIAKSHEYTLAYPDIREIPRTQGLLKEGPHQSLRIPQNCRERETVCHQANGSGCILRNLLICINSVPSGARAVSNYGSVILLEWPINWLFLSKSHLSINITRLECLQNLRPRLSPTPQLLYKCESRPWQQLTDP